MIVRILGLLVMLRPAPMAQQQGNITKPKIVLKKRESTPELITIVLSQGQLDSLHACLSYLYDTEYQDYKERDSDDRDEHIYNDIKNVDRALPGYVSSEDEEEDLTVCNNKDCIG